MTAETTMMAYSMSKTITATAVLQLVEAQKIALDSPIDRYLDSQPYGTARDFGVFLQDQLQPRSRPFDDGTRRLFYEQQQTKQGAAIAMTLGWHIGSTGGARFFYKEGGGGGFHSMMRIYPGDGIGTVVMTNATGFDVRRLLDDIDRRFLHLAQNRHR